ncbi:glycosyltransferase [Pseudonocardiaceae bacterium YIM PH 21723]|nr:glycosyltransferase [Pseudonocardiaceae bacterium YIM PH 21723]
MLSLAIALISIVLFVIAIANLYWTLHAWRTPANLRNTTFPAPDGDHSLSFSILIPARYEEAVLEHTVTQLLQSGHPDIEILLIIGHDDFGTAEVADWLAYKYPDKVRVIVDTNKRKNKPKALNTALPYCRGDIVGVFDAEDLVHPDLLTHVDYAFRATNATVVQGGVQLINFHSSWYSLRNCLEYFFWFRSRLHLQAEAGFIPLGGNTVFVRTDTLNQIGGWDPSCLAEDCELGVRLSSRGHKVVVAYDAVLVTREETPDSAASFFRQRTRWNQGFMQVFRKGDWRRIASFRQRALARFTLASPFLQAFTGLAAPVGLIVALVLHLPVWVTLLSFLPGIPTLAQLAFEAAGLHDLGKLYNLKIERAHYVKLVVAAPLYTLVLAGAALRAIARELVGRRDWELTRHVGAHLT